MESHGITVGEGEHRYDVHTAMMVSEIKKMRPNWEQVEDATERTATKRKKSMQSMSAENVIKEFPFLIQARLVSTRLTAIPFFNVMVMTL